MKKKILMIGPLPPPLGGGMEAFIESIFESELPKIVNLKLLNTIVADIYFKYRPLRILLFFKFLILLILRLFIFKPAIVHVHTSSYMGFWEKSIFIIVSKIFNKKVVLHIHGSGFDNFCNSSKFKKYIFSILYICNKVIVLSDYWKVFFKEYIPEEKIEIVQNGIKINHFYKITRQENTINILFVGSIGERKGLYVILNSIVNSRMLQKENIQFQFLGKGILEQDYQNVIDAYSEYDFKNIHFLGRLAGEEKYNYFRNSDIFILPSFAEGLPIAILEAMASSLPIISSTVGGIPDLIKKQNGILIPPGDSQALSDAIITLIRDKELRKKMGEENRYKIEKKYTLSNVISKLNHIYKHI